MQELDVIDLAEARRCTIVYVRPSAEMIIVEVGPELIDYMIDENGLKEISPTSVGPRDLVDRLIEDRNAGD